MWQIIGQAKAVDFLERAFKADRLAHGYLIAGPPHVGKMTLAVNLAQALNCTGALPPCLECPACKKIAAGGHADVQVIGLKFSEKDEEKELKNISIDQVEAMQHDASLPPFEGKHKVFIIDGAELMSQDAANRFLKTLEEPEKHVTFILLCSNDRLLLPTILSRCQRLELAPMSIDKEAAALEQKLHLAPEKARLLAGLSHGCPGWAIGAAGDDAVMERRGLELDQIAAAIRGDADARFAYAGKLAAGFTQNRAAVYDILDRWLDYWRDLMLVKLGRTEMITNADRQAELAAIAGGLRFAGITDYIKSIQAAALELRQNVNPRLALEVLMLDIPREEVTSSR